MALILDAFAQPLAERFVKLAEDRITMILGVKDDLDDLNSKVKLLLCVVSDAESRKIRDSSVQTWVTNLREILYDAEDLLDDCHLEGEKPVSSSAAADPQPQCCSLSPLSCFRNLPHKNEMGKRIRAINSRLEKLYKEISVLHLVQHQGDAAAPPLTPRPSAPLVADDDIVGIDEDAKDLVDLLIGGGKCPIFAITGMAGIGKSTLAQKITGDPQVKARFHVTIPLQVTNSYNRVELLNEIVRYVKRHEGKGDDLRAKTYNEAANVVRGLVDSMTLFLVLDDIWDAKVWDDLRSPLSTIGNGSRVLVTTRNRNIVADLNAYEHQARVLTQKEGWLMLRRQVFGDDGDKGEISRDLERTGMQIVENCKGLPLAIKTIAGLLKRRERTKKEWEAVRDSPTWNMNNLGNDVKPGLLLSYEDLPPQLKQCFVYCSLFPSGYRFHHQTLVQMWIAEGLVKPEGSRALEDIGDDCYKELVMRNLLQASPEYYEGRGCTMHDLVRSLAKYVSTGDCEAFAKERHKFFVKKDSDTAPEIVERECVRTILISKDPKIKSLPSDYFNGLRHLRVLDLTHTGIKNLPESLGELVQLRFLNLAFTRIRAIPESIGRLQNLETLKANDLKHMEVLPKAITLLSNLRHLAVGSALKQLTSLPVGIGNLRKLRTLSGFVANDGESNMKELRNLRDLSHVSMYRLEKVASDEEAQAAELDKMTRLNFLRLSCTRIARGQRLEEDELVRIQEVFEGLKPPENLEALHIDGFFGHHLPVCIRKCSLGNLNWLRLDDCKFIEQLPPLGKLPYLKALQIWGAVAVSKIGPEFFSGAGFPSLVEFYLKGMTKLKEIAAVEPGVLPRLKKLQVIRCPKLGSLPDGLENATKLTHLLIEDAENIKKIRNLGAVTELKLNGNSKLKVISGLRSLNFLTISKCHALNEVDSPDDLSYLSISDDTMQALPEWLSSITLLRRLTVKGNRDLVTRCTMNGLDWHKIVDFPHVDVRTNDDTCYIAYRKDPFSFQSNLTGDNLDDPPPKSTFDAFEDEEYSAMSFRSPYEP